MRRRECLALSFWLAFVPLTSAHSQQQVRKLAILHPALPLAEFQSRFRPFFEALARNGFVEGQNLVVFRYSGEGIAARFDEIAREAVAAQPDVIFAINTRLVRATRAFSESIPIVAQSSDPVSNGLTLSLARPTQNVTGVTVDAGWNAIEKHIQLLREVVPNAKKLAMLTPGAVWDGPQGLIWRQTATRLGIELVPWALGKTANRAEYERSFAAARSVDGLLVGDASENFTNAPLVVQLAREARIPAVYPGRIFAEAGGAISYGPDLPELYRRAAGMVSEIFKGAPVSDIPFYQAQKFELVLNMRAGRETLPSIPTALLVRADEVIE
jgi:putative tryptophan/tyrosine transport system substrate-binding protein